MRSVTVLLLVALAIACQPGEAATSDLPVVRVGMYPIHRWSVTPHVDTFERAVLVEMSKAGKFRVAVVELNSVQERIDCLTGGTTTFPDPGCDAVMSRFTVTPERQELVAFLAPYYYGDGAGLKARRLKTANQAVVSDDPAIAYAPYVVDGNKTTVCIQTGSAYTKAATKFGFKLVFKPDAASIVADKECALMITDSIVAFPPFVKVNGPMLADTLAPWAVAVQLTKPNKVSRQDKIRAYLQEGAISIYQGTPGNTFLELDSRPYINVFLESGDLTPGSVAVKNGALFMNQFFY